LRMSVLQMCERASLESAVKNKLALLMAVIVWKDYPQEWPTAFREFGRDFGRCGEYLDLFLRFLNRFYEEIFSDEANVDKSRVRALKDHMKQADMEFICGRYMKSVADFPCETLKCMEEAVHWMDYGLLWSSEIIQCTVKYLHGEEACCIQAANFLQELLDKKGIDARRKLQLIDEHQLINCILGACRAEGTLAMREHRAEVLNHLAEALLKCTIECRQHEWKEATEAWNQCESVLPTVWECFAHEDFEIVDSIEPFMKYFTKNLRDLEACVDISQMIEKILPLCVRNMRYPSWFAPENVELEDERHLNFEELRLSMKAIFMQIMRLDAGKTMIFLKQAVHHVCQSSQMSEIESVLSVLFHLLKEMRMQDVLRDNNAHLSGILRTILDSDLAKRTRECAEIQIHLLEIYVRCSPILQNRDGGFTSYIPNVMEEMVVCIRGLDKRIAPRAAYLLRQMAKSNRTQVAHCALPLAQSLNDVFPKSPYQKVILERADIRHIYEALGYLATCIDEPESFVKAALESAVQPLAEVGKLPDDVIERDYEYLVTFGANAIEVVASFSIPFTSKAPLRSVWESVVLAVLSFAKRFRSDLVRSNCVFLCRRMVSLLQDDFSLALHTFFTEVLCVEKPLSSEEWTTLASLMNLAVLDFRNARPFLEILFAGAFVEAVSVFYAVELAQDTSREMRRERETLQEALLRFLLTSVGAQTHYMAALLSTGHASLLRFLVSSLSGQALQPNDFVAPNSLLLLLFFILKTKEPITHFVGNLTRMTRLICIIAIPL